jgi:CRP/FNR family transcriptional regulator
LCGGRDAKAELNPTGKKYTSKSHKLDVYKLTMITEADVQKLAVIYPVLRHLPVPLLRNLQETSHDLAAQAGQVLCDANADCDYMPLLKTGSVRVVLPLQTGWEMLLYRVSPGQVCILTATCILGDGRHLARVIADKDLKAVSISKDVLDRLIEGSPDFRRFVFSNYSISLLSWLNCMEVALTQPIAQRLAQVLLEKRSNLINMTHQGLADEVGTAREVVSRILKDFEEKGIVKLKRGMVLIQDEGALAQAFQNPCD